MTISPVTTQPDLFVKSMNYNYLRRLALLLVQRYSKDKWTDHNTHDPGITIIEILSYVLTELGQRLNLPIEDILANQENPNDPFLKEMFPPAEHTLTCKAATVKDFRKIILNLKEIKNVYFEESDKAEHDIYYDVQSGKLVFQTSPVRAGNKGIYNILLEFERSDADDLNSNIIDSLNGNSIYITVPSTEESRTFKISMALHYWDEADPGWITQNGVEAVIINGHAIGIETNAASCDNNLLSEIIIEHYYIEPNIAFYGGRIIEKVPVNISISPWIPAAETSLNIEIIAALESLLSTVKGITLFDNYRKKILAINEIIPKVKLVFHQNRNLCEDLFNIQSVKTQEMAINCTIEIKPGQDPVDLLAKIFTSINLFFSPSISYSTFQYLKDIMKVEADRIYEGPLLNQGLMMEEELDSLTRQDIVYTSDIIRLIMRTEGVFSVASMRLDSYVDNYKVINCEPNCLRLLSKQYKPKLSIEKSRIILCRNGLVISFTPEMELRLVGEYNNLINIKPSESERSIILHESRDYFRNDLEEYKSVQFEFPDNFRIGKAMLSDGSEDFRRGFSKQLQAYLYFFDLIISSYYSQLKNIGNLYSLSPVKKKTYFFQPLYDIPGIRDLLKNFNSLSETWESFIHNSTNAYESALNDVFEDQSIFEQRRNEILNYLLARYAEDFDEYTFLMQSIYGNSALSEVIFDKTRFLKSYPQLSPSRSSAFNYLALNDEGNADVWDTENISGYEKMIYARLGFRSIWKRHLFHPLSAFFEIYDETDTDNNPGKRFRMVNRQRDILLSSTTHYTNEESAWVEINDVLNCFGSLSNYKIIKSGSGRFFFNLCNNNGEIIARRIQPFPDEEKTKEVIAEVIKFFYVTYSMEGFHLVEHNLLRPRYDLQNLTGEDLLQGIKYNNLPLEDPYSFIMTIIIPSGYSVNFATDSTRQPITGSSEKIRNDEFINYASRIMRREAPANVMVNIFQLDVHFGSGPSELVSLQEFESAYRQWMESVANPLSSEQQKRLDQRALIKILNKIYQYV